MYKTVNVYRQNTHIYIMLIYYMRIKKNLKYQTFKRKQESFHNVQIIAILFFLK